MRNEGSKGADPALEPGDPTALEPSTHTSADFLRNGRPGRFERPRAHCRAELSKDPRPARKSQTYGKAQETQPAACPGARAPSFAQAIRLDRPIGPGAGGFCTRAQTAASPGAHFPNE